MNEFIRNFRKQKTVGLLNIASLSLGIMVSIIVGLWAINELSFDRFHKDKEQIYHLVQHVDFNGMQVKGASVFKPFGEEIKASLPQVEEVCRITFNKEDMRVNEKLYPGTDYLSADEDFFTFFSFELLEGDPKTVLSTPDKVVLSEQAAKDYFPGQNPIGQSMHLAGADLIVSGVMKDMPKNSSIQANIITPFFGWELTNGWGNSDSYVTFLKVPDKGALNQIEETCTQLMVKALPMFEGLSPRYELAPLTGFHFDTGFLYDPMVKGNKSLVMVFALVAIVILIISCINFTNLFISTSFLRARTVGIKKAQGAYRETLVAGFYGETACYILIAILSGLFLAHLALPVFNSFTQSELTIDPTSKTLYLFLAGLFLFTVLLAGTFPAIYITRFNPIETLFGKFKGKNISFFQKTLLIAQFTAAIALLIVVSFMQKQVNHMISQDLGFDKENVIYVKGKGTFGKDFNTFRNEMLQHPTILDVTRKEALPMEWAQGWGVRRQDQPESEFVIMEINFIQENYLDFMKMTLIEGENPFHEEINQSRQQVIISQRAAEILSLDNPIGAIINLGGDIRDAEVRGVIKDVMVRSFHDEMHPQVYLKHSDDYWRRILFFKITGDPQQAIAILKKEWEQLNPNDPFEYHFLDETYARMYTAEMNAGRVLSFAMLITFIISIAGLFAMAFYASQRRIKEIALRKINGASLKDLLLLLNKNFIIWTLISFVLACPIAYFVLDKWLSAFVVKTPLNAWVFLGIGVIAVLVTILTTSFQTWKIATMNPVDALKSE